MVLRMKSWPEPKRVRTRGRPRVNRIKSDPIAASSNITDSQRLPHNQVEHKYREGINAELERLRGTVPTLPQRDSSDLNGPPRPSKATVLANAIDYIQFLEAECGRLTDDNERLRGPAHCRPRRIEPRLSFRALGEEEQANSMDDSLPSRGLTC
ncbi:uncharacterized protein BDZ99DRAFT_566487 [Mytilinidion resinicola]|uniref:BHLH domain-containing protein n=1 Tax=Mytilinidion resinicola TaxID=574789 RepID=A0A6A6Z7J6_9PEZI|nr:uncharacterized protein BDZ99DRAFT_566487 [Mytilinidion resinicola]KAF2816689.1 hypothetical protein BDZ99DRAFT_566487 [Mytilinidion resinicola]